MLPPNVTIKRKAPGTYGVYRRYRAGTGLVGIMLGDVQGHAGDVQRDRATGKWTATPSGTTLPVTTGHPTRDAAAAALFARPPADG